MTSDIVFVRLDGKGDVTELHWAPGRGLKAADLRRLPLGRLVAMATPRPDLQLAMIRSGDDWPDPKILPALEKAFPKPRKREAPDTQARLTAPTEGLTPEFLRQVAAAYVAALHRDEKPIRALTEQAGVSPRSVERWVYLARKGGYLAPTRRGSVG